MAEDDIYGSKAIYEHKIATLDTIVEKPKKGGKGKYYCKNKENIKYFKKMIDYFELKDLSYVRRKKVIQVLKVITFVLEKDLAECTREDVNELVAFSHTICTTVHSKKDFIKDLKAIWKIILPEKDHNGRVDETLIPYVVRHISGIVDKSKEKLRNDRITYDEFKKLLTFFSGDATMQAYLALAFESLGRPQEILYTRVKDYEFYDTYAKIWISEHGKEGTGFLQCIDSYPYVMQWYKEHPFRQDSHAFFFLNKGNRGKYQQVKNHNINMRLRHACKSLGIKKRVTCYSLKRNGITYRRLRGDSDMQIQHAARWNSTKQLKIYDMSTQQDALKIELERRGIKGDKMVVEEWKPKVCSFCGCDNGFPGDFCSDAPRQYMFEALKKHMEDPKSKVQWYDIVGKKEAQKMIKKSLEDGRKVLEFLNSFNVPVYATPGNWDWTKEENAKWSYLKKDNWKSLIKGLKNIKDTHHTMVDAKEYAIIGHGISSGPEYPQCEEDVQRLKKKKKFAKVKREYLKEKKKVSQLFKKAKKPVIFTPHNVPFNTSLDQITNLASPRNGYHYGSLIAREMVDQYQPLVCIGGHMHEHFGKEELGKTLCINAGFGSKVNTLLVLEGNKVKSVEFWKE